MIIHDFIYSVFYGGEYEWHGSKIDTLGLTNPTFQSQAKMIHVDFWSSGMEKLFSAARNFSDGKKKTHPRTKIFVFLLFSSTLKLWDYSKGKVINSLYIYVDLTKLLGKLGFYF